MTVRATPETVALRVAARRRSRSTQAPARALQSLGIAAAPIGGDSLAFPITGGRVNARTYAGSIAHSGGIALSRGATRVELTEFTIGIDDTPELTALVGGHARADPDRRPDGAEGVASTAGRSRSKARR